MRQAKETRKFICSPVYYTELYVSRACYFTPRQHNSSTFSNAPEKTTGNQKAIQTDISVISPSVWRRLDHEATMNWKPHWCRIKFSRDKCFSQSVSLLFSPAALLLYRWNQTILHNMHHDRRPWWWSCDPHDAGDVWHPIEHDPQDSHYSEGMTLWVLCFALYLGHVCVDRML